jgi:hypothetical protein
LPALVTAKGNGGNQRAGDGKPMLSAQSYLSMTAQKTRQEIHLAGSLTWRPAAARPKMGSSHPLNGLADCHRLRDTWRHGQAVADCLDRYVAAPDAAGGLRLLYLCQACADLDTSFIYR